MITVAKPALVKTSPPATKAKSTSKEGTDSRMAKAKQTTAKAAAPRGGANKGAEAAAASFIDNNPLLKNTLAQVNAVFQCKVTINFQDISGSS